MGCVNEAHAPCRTHVQFEQYRHIDWQRPNNLSLHLGPSRWGETMTSKDTHLILMRLAVSHLLHVSTL
jgi:hypothetical protein